MKFTNTIAALLVASSALAATRIETPECNQEFEKIKDCYYVEMDLNKICTSECEEFFNNPSKFVPHCMGSDYIEIGVKFGIHDRKMACSKDESGKQCPFSKYVHSYNPDVNKTASETCVSSACTQATIEYYKGLEPISHPTDAAKYRDILALLDASECKAKQSSASSSDNKKTDGKTENSQTPATTGSTSAPVAGGVPAANGGAPAAGGAPANNSTAPVAGGASASANNSTTPAANATSDATTTKVASTLMVSLGLLLLSYF